MPSTVQILEATLLVTLACAVLADACGANGMTMTPAWALFALSAMWTSEVNTRPIALALYICCITIITDIAYLGAVSSGEFFLTRGAMTRSAGVRS